MGKFWNNNVAMIVLSAILLIGAFILLSGDLLLFVIISEIITIGLAVYINKDSDSKEDLGKAIFIATLVGLVFGLIVGIISGVELYPSSGDACGVCGGSGLVPKDGFGYTKCPYCKGSGIPPL